MTTRAPIRAVGAAILGVVVFFPAVAAGQQPTPPALGAEAALAKSAPATPVADPPPPVIAPLREYGRASILMQSLYATTATIQAMDARSTFKALDQGAVESNSLVAPISNNRPAFVALKVAMSAAFIWGGHTMSKHHKVGAVITLGVLNSVYTAIVLHNYDIAHRMAGLPK